MGSSAGGDTEVVRLGDMRAEPGIEELKSNIDRLNYFYYLLSHPAASVRENSRRRGGDGRARRIAP